MEKEKEYKFIWKRYPGFGAGDSDQGSWLTMVWMEVNVLHSVQAEDSPQKNEMFIYYVWIKGKTTGKKHFLPLHPFYPLPTPPPHFEPLALETMGNPHSKILPNST